MPAKKHNQAELDSLLQTALKGEARLLENYLIKNSNLPGPRMNLALAAALADTIGKFVMQPMLNVERLETMLDGWAADDADTDQPRVILPCAAMLAYGQVAASRPEWWSDEIAKLHRAAADSRWRVREMVSTALQRMLAADWSRTIAALSDWLKSDNPLIVRAAAAGVAEPPLLIDIQRGADALKVQATAVDWFAALPQSRRDEDDIRKLRKTLGFSVSVAVTAVPDAGFELLLKMAHSDNEDLRRIVRENLKKSRLQRFPEQVEQVQAVLEAHS